MMNKKCMAVCLALVIAAVPVFAQDTAVTPGQDNTDQVKLRLIHAVPNAPNVSVSIGGTEVFQEAQFKQITPYKVIPKQEDSKITIKLADGRELQTTEEFDLDDGDEAYTVLVTPDDEGPNPKVVVLEDDADAGDVNILGGDDRELTIINASPQHRSIKVQLNDDDLASGIDYARSEQENVEPGQHTLKILSTEGDNNVIASQSISPGVAGSYTLVFLGENDVAFVNDLSPDQPMTGQGSAVGTGTTTGTDAMATTGPGTMATGTDSVTTTGPGAMRNKQTTRTGSMMNNTGTNNTDTDTDTMMSTMPVTSPGL